MTSRPPEGADVSAGGGGEAPPRTAIDVKIGGERYTLRAEADERHLMRCVTMVEARVRKVAGPGIRPGKAAILAALTLADELLRQQKWTTRRIKELTERVEEALEEDEPKGE